MYTRPTDALRAGDTLYTTVLDPLSERVLGLGGGGCVAEPDGELDRTESVHLSAAGSECEDLSFARSVRAALQQLGLKPPRKKASKKAASLKAAQAARVRRARPSRALPHTDTL